jgi:uncharacterized protein YbjT (DUF2867 family)
VLVAGSSGLIGREIVRALLAGPPSTTVHALVRRPAPGPGSPRLHSLTVDFTALPSLPGADSAYCALGTTIKVAGSQQAFKAVDLDAVLAFAQAARRAGVRRFAVVSSLGANPRSGNFYSRVKGDMEAALSGCGFDTLVMARPSLLAGDRASLGQPARPGERWTLALTAPLWPLIPAAWRPIQAVVVARAMIAAIEDGQTGTRIIESGEMQRSERADR